MKSSKQSVDDNARANLRVIRDLLNLGCVHSARECARATLRELPSLDSTLREALATAALGNSSWR